MSKRITHWSVSALCALALLLSLTARAQAASTAHLMTLDETTNVMVILTFDREEPDFSFTAPDGAVYTEGSDLMTVERQEGTLYCHIPAAPPGDWSVTYDKKSNSALSVRFVRYTDVITIRSLTPHPVEGDRMEAVFQADFARDESFHYRLTAAVKDENGLVTGRRELTSGTATANREVSVSVPLDRLERYDAYYLGLEVWLDVDGVEVQDSLDSDVPFAYAPTDVSDGLEAVALTLDLSGTLTADWSGNDLWYFDSVLLGVFADGETEPFYQQEYDRDESTARVVFPPSTATLRLELTARRDGRTACTLARTLTLAELGQVTVDTPAQTSAAQAVISYDFSARTELTASVGDSEQVLSLEGTGSFSLPIGEFDNALSLRWSPTVDLTVLLTRSIYSDRTAPRLTLYEIDGPVSTQADRYVLAGGTEPGCTLAVGTETVQVRADGTFLHTVSLKPGENLLEVAAADPAGNRAVQPVTIYRGDAPALPGGGGETDGGGGLGGWLPLLLSLGASLVLLAVVLAVARRKGGPSGTGMTLLAVFRGLAWGLTALCGVALALLLLRQGRLGDAVNTKDFFSLAQDSFSTAYDTMSAYDTARAQTVWAAIATSVSLVLAGLTTAGGVLLSRRKKTPPGT